MKICLQQATAIYRGHEETPDTATAIPTSNPSHCHTVFASVIGTYESLNILMDLWAITSAGAIALASSSVCP
jgi:hypothetical protein